MQSTEQRANTIDALSSETTLSEILRVRILFGIFGAIFAGSLAFYLFAPAAYANLFENRVDIRRMPVFFSLVALYYALLLFALVRFGRHAKNLPLIGRLLSAAVEGALPSAALYLFAPQGDLAGALAMPPLLAYAFFIILSVIRLNFYISIATGLSAAITYLACAHHLLATNAAPYDSVLFTVPNHIAKAFFLLMASAIAGFVASQLRKRILAVLESVKQKQELETLFGEHVSQEVVQKLVASRGESLAEIRQITALFLDIRSFTTFSESRTAHEVYEELNKLLGFMIDIVQAHAGIINKFLGDGFLAVFGAPLDDNSHAKNAVESARQISRELKRKIAAGEVVNLGVGIGIHSGEALTGNVGSNKRKEYTVIGDVINVASRIEQLNKQFGTEILVSEAVVAAVENPAAFVAQGEVQVKGRERPVAIYGLA